MGGPGYSFGNHPSDLELIARGRTLKELFAEAGRGLIEYASPPEPAGPRQRRMVRLSAADREELLVSWLDEIIYLLETGFLPRLPLEIERLDHRMLRTSLAGRVLPPGATFAGSEVKAATYHRLEIRRFGRLWQARVILDL